MPARYSIHAVLVISPLLLLAGCNEQGSQQKTAGPPSQTPVAQAPVAPAKTAPGRLTFVAGFDAGSRLARQTGKPMLVFFTATWCKFCHDMEADAFIDGEVVRLADGFVCVRVDADQEPAVSGQFGVRGYPTVQFVSSDGSPLNRLVGRAGARELAAQMQAALRATTERASAEKGRVLR